MTPSGLRLGTPAMTTRGVLEKLQVEVGLRLVVSVAVVAILLEERLHSLAEILGRQGWAQGDQDREAERAGPQSPDAVAQGSPHGVHKDKIAPPRLQPPGCEFVKEW